MKKVALIGLLSMAMAGWMAPVFAELPEEIIKVECVAGNTATLSSTIVVNSRVYGIFFTDSAAGSGAGFDAATAAGVSEGATFTSSGGFADVRVAAGTGETILFPFPKKIVNGYVTWNSASTGNICTYYR
jgi:hypothetical protein